MGIASGIVLFLVIWSMTFLTIIPIRIQTQGEAGDVVPGTHDGSPQKHHLKKKAWLTTAIAAVLWVIIAGVIFTGAVLEGTPADPATTTARMEDLLARREASQPVRSRTGGSTFRNPSGASSTGGAGDDQALKAWSLIEAAGCRGLVVGDAQVSEKHCNFLINRGAATAADLETLGETVRDRVKAHSGVDLRWEIRRIGVIVTD